MRSCFRALVVTVCLLSGCQRQKIYDQRDQYSLATRWNLGAWASLVVALNESQIDGKPIDLTQFKTTDDLASIIHGGDFDFINHDAWDRPFEWSVRTEGERTIVRLTSYGNNGINENGEGDDLYLEVTFVKDREPEILLKDELGEIVHATAQQFMHP